eukprot:6458993-Amphidinium_carterae.2
MNDSCSSYKFDQEETSRHVFTEAGVEDVAKMMPKLTSQHDTFGGQQIDFAAMGHAMVSNAGDVSSATGAAGAFADNGMRIENLADILPEKEELSKVREGEKPLPLGNEATPDKDKDPENDMADGKPAGESGGSVDKKKFFQKDIAVANARASSKLKLAALEAPSPTSEQETSLKLHFRVVAVVPLGDDNPGVEVLECFSVARAMRGLKSIAREGSVEGYRATWVGVLWGSVLLGSLV